MNIWKLSFKNAFNRPMAAALTIIMLAMGVALASLLSIVGNALDGSFKQNIRGVDMVVGAKGSPLGLILSAVYQIDDPTGNISKKEADKLAQNRMISESIQLSFGDSYKGRRIIGTSHKYVGLYGGKLSDGVLWKAAFQATVGSQVASELDLKIGDTFFSAHGSDQNAEEHTEHPFTIVGILRHTGTVLDRVVLTAPESVYELHESHDGATADSIQDMEITAMLIKFRNKMGIITLPRIVNEQTNMQAALPAIEVNRLIGLFGIGISTLKIIAIIILLLGAISVFVSMVNSLRDRAYELALIRSMGASKAQVFTMIITESIILGAVGTLAGVILSHLGIAVLNIFTKGQFGININVISLNWEELFIMFLAIAICILAALLPAVKTTKMDVSKTLAEYEN